jgi:integrase/recombinase XerD
MTQPNVLRFTTPKKDKNAARTNPRSERLSFSPAQLKAFMGAAKQAGPRQYALCIVGVSHGCRVSELCDLRLGDIKWEQGLIHIRRKKNSEDSLQPMSAKEVSALRAYLKTRPEVDSDIVFVSREHGGSRNCEKEADAKYRMSRSQVFRIFQAICEEAGIPPAYRHCHVLKHTLAKILLARGENAFTVQKALGHRSIQSTLAYSRPSDAEAGSAIVSALKGML